MTLVWHSNFQVSFCHWQAKWLWSIANLKSLMQWNRDCFKFKLLDSKKLYLGVYNHCGRRVCPSAKCDVGHETEWLEYGTAGSIQEHLATKIVCIQIFQHIKTERHSNFQIFYLKKFQGAAGLLEGCSIWLAPWAAAAGCTEWWSWAVSAVDCWTLRSLLGPRGMGRNAKGDSFR